MTENISIEENVAGEWDNIKSFFWQSGANFYKFTKEERNRVCKTAENIDDQSIVSGGTVTWFASFLNSIIYFLNSYWKNRLILKFLSIGKMQAKLGLDGSYFENLSRLGFALSKKTTQEVYEFLLAAEYDGAYLQEYLACCGCLFDYFTKRQKTSLEQKIGQRYREFFGYSLGEHHISGGSADVVLLIPDFLSGKSFLQPSTGTLTAATILNARGVKVQVIDNRLYHLNLKNLMNTIAKLNPKLVVLEATPYDQVSIYYCDYRLNLIEFYAKQIVKNKSFVFGICGSHCNVNPLEMLTDAGADFAFQGEWDTAIPNFYDEFFNKQKKFCDIANLVWIENNQLKKSFIDPSLYAPDVNTLPIPDYSLVEMPMFFGDEYIDNMHKLRKRWASILAQRGCSFACKFCYNFFGRNVRQRSVTSVADEMEILQNDFKVEQLFFIDYTFTIDKLWVLELCKEIKKRNLFIKWNCETRVDCLDLELLDAMKNANCCRIWLGAESFSDNVLSNCNKQISKEQTIDIIDKIKNAGINVSCFLMLGLPEENKGSILELIKTLRERNINYTKSIITFIPRKGTTFFEELKSESLNDDFRSMYASRGLVDNNVSVNDLINTIEVMSKRKI